MFLSIFFYLQSLQETTIHASGGIRTHNPSKWAYSWLQRVDVYHVMGNWFDRGRRERNQTDGLSVQITKENNKDYIRCWNKR